MKRYGVRGYDANGIAYEKWLNAESESKEEVEALRTKSGIVMIVTLDLVTWDMKRIINAALTAKFTDKNK